jgi:DNA polymerase-3 subunit delta
MVAIKAHQADAFLKSPAANLAAFLFFGPDAGLVTERAQRLAEARATADAGSEILRLDDLDLETDSDRLGNELLTVPMFGGRKIVRVTTGRRINANLLKSLIATPLEGTLIVEAGNLKGDDALRTAFEKSPTCAAIPCYADEGGAIDRLISEVLTGHKLTISPEARALLAERLGADRALSRSEIEKLALYAHGRARIDPEDIAAAVGDASELAIDRVIDAALAGDARQALDQCDRAFAAGETEHAIIAAAQRHLQRLHRVRTGLDAGRSLDDVLRQFRPPLHFRARDALAADARRWTTPTITRALAAIGDAQRRTRQGLPIEAVLVERMLLEIAWLGRRTEAASRSLPR